tara:strand:- start:507 stop:644 length:138 start_codon:yes stop_codon:yes gene_type:complete
MSKREKRWDQGFKDGRTYAPPRTNHPDYLKGYDEGVKYREKERDE